MDRRLGSARANLDESRWCRRFRAVTGDDSCSDAGLFAGFRVGEAYWRQRPADPDDLLPVHPAAYVEYVRRRDAEGSGSLDGRDAPPVAHARGPPFPPTQGFDHLRARGGDAAGGPRHAIRGNTLHHRRAGAGRVAGTRHPRSRLPQTTPPIYARS